MAAVAARSALTRSTTLFAPNRRTQPGLITQWQSKHPHHRPESRRKTGAAPIRPFPFKAAQMATASAEEPVRVAPSLVR